MTDSISVKFFLDEYFYLGLDHLEPQDKTPSFKNLLDELSAAFQDAITASSPLTEAKYKITPCRADYGTQISALLVELNSPACGVGNNVIVENRVFSAANFALLLLQYQMLELGLNGQHLRMVSLRNAELDSVTLTYLLPFESHTDALKANRELFHYGEVIKKPREGARYRPVNQYGGSEVFTGYFKAELFEITSYVKSGPTPKSFSSFEKTEDEEMIYGVGESKLRIEIKFHRKWLDIKGCYTPEEWKNGKGRKLYREGMRTIRDYFRFDEGFRTRRPKPEYMKKISALDRSILEKHFEGADLTQYLASLHKNDRYLAKARKRILSDLRIDLSIPWIEQSKKLSSSLPDMVTYHSRYRPTNAEAALSFYGKTVSGLLSQMRDIIRRKLKQPIE